MAIARYLTLACVSSLAFFAACEDEEEDTLCTGDTVLTRTDPTADFTLYHTFAVSAEPLPSDVRADVEANLGVANAAASAQLVALGLTPVAVDADPPPDLTLFNIAATKLQQGTQWVCSPGYIWIGWYYVWDPCAWMVEVPFLYTEGTLIVGVADPVLTKVVFGGVLEGIMECGPDTASRIQSGVARIFEDYPTAE